MSLAHRCEVCAGHPAWILVRQGDVVTTWACRGHLHEIADRLQRDHEITNVVLMPYDKAVEWAAITQALAAVEKEQP